MHARSRTGSGPDPVPGAGEAGFTLVEVIVALVLLALVAVAVLGLFVRAMKDVTGLDRRQAAVAVAAQSLELARSIPAVRGSSGNSTLISGRTQAAVSAQWAAATGADLSQTDTTWDTTATSSSTPALPLTAATTVAGVTYTTANLVGTCWRPAGGGDCVKAVAKAASSVLMYRVIVFVTWSDGPGTTCSGSACGYTLASLVDPGDDPAFNVNATNATWPAAPVLTVISAATSRDRAVTVDLAGAVTSGATPLTAATGAVTLGATASVLPNTTSVTVTPAAGYVSGSAVTVPFTITDPYGQSASSTLTVHVNAALSAASFAAGPVHGGPFSIDLSPHVSGGTGTVSYTVSNSAPSATVTVSGSTVTYKSTGSFSGTTTFTYTASTSFGDTATGTVTVTVT
jgi:prepilin-type N-terminal cleavage/methylation domain-containing protein